MEKPKLQNIRIGILQIVLKLNVQDVFFKIQSGGRFHTHKKKNIKKYYTHGQRQLKKKNMKGSSCPTNRRTKRDLRTQTNKTKTKPNPPSHQKKTKIKNKERKQHKIKQTKSLTPRKSPGILDFVFIFVCFLRLGFLSSFLLPSLQLLMRLSQDSPLQM